MPGATSIWSSWFKNCLLQNKGFWTAKIPYKCPWAARKILNYRSFAMQYIRYHIGNTSEFLFWHDPWVCNVPLVVQFPAHVISTAESQSLTTMGSYILNGVWNLPRSNHVDLMELRDKVSRTQIHSTDFITWNGVRKNNVSTSTIWQSFRNSSSSVPWFLSVWNSASIPKCSFIFWLAIKNRLLTRDRMLAFGMRTEAGCLLCNTGLESVSHIFTNCPYFDLVRAAGPITVSNDWMQWQNGQFFNRGNLKLRCLSGVCILVLLCTQLGRRETSGYIMQGPLMELSLLLARLNKLCVINCFQVLCLLNGLKKTPGL